MPKISVDPETLKTEAQRLTQAKLNLDATMDAIQTLSVEVLSNWEGNAQRAFNESYEAKKKVYKDLSADIDKFAEFLRDYAYAIEMIDAGGANRASGLASDEANRAGRLA